jgi:serine phosphatase RsbU (regulator of sigma subunit)/CHASE2 domain-containing sensor protein
VNAPPAREPAGAASGWIRFAGGSLLALLVAVVWVQPRSAAPLQAGWFDTLQTLYPRRVGAYPVTVVEIDQKSLAALGQWPWPRTVLARLLRQIDSARPAAIGVNILMPEPDALSPQRLLDSTPVDDEAVAAALKSLPSNDAVLARAIADTGAVLAVAGAPEPTGMRLRAAPVMVRADAGDSAAALAVTRYSGALASIDELNRAAAGWGLISVDAAGGIVRRVPLVASIDGTLVPTLALEMLRVAADARAVRVTASGASVAGVSIADLNIPTEADGSLRVYFSGHAPERFVSALDVLDGRADPELIERKLVLVGITGIGLHEYLDTPIGERMSGAEIQAQLLENLLGGTWLRRPPSAPLAEALALLLAGGLLLWATPKWRPFAAAATMLGLAAVLLAIAAVAFRSQRLLLDAATPGVGLALLFGVALTLTLAEANRQRRLLERTVQAQREQAARVAGELAAAQRIQNSTLPRADLLAGDRRIDLAATLTPAREVGGDLYDYFRLGERRLFFLIGDVAGKGLSASIFMAVSKALYKSVTLRTPLEDAGDADLGRIMSLANAEVSRDNGEMLFVTAFAGLLDLDSGELAYCNAGHDNPYRLHPGGHGLARIADGDGPPLAAVPDFPYAGARCRLLPGELLCLMSDGVAEARSPAGELYGAQRVEKVLLGCGARARARDVVQALQADVLAFADGAEPADDLTILVLRWNGPEAA